MKILNLLMLAIFLSTALYAQVEVAPPQDDEEKLFDQVEVDASFAGGDQGWRRFLERTLNASEPVENGAPGGSYTVRIKFIVSRDGTVSNIVATTNHGYGMEEECIKAIKKSGKWTPALQNGKPVNAYRIQPITFQIVDEGNDTDSLYEQNDVVAVDQRAYFPGGGKAFSKFLYDNLRTKELAKKIKFPAGETYIYKKVRIQFTVQKDGTLSQIMILDLDKIDPLIKSEAKRVISTSPKWIPAKKDGKPVSTHQAISIYFDINKK